MDERIRTLIENGVNNRHRSMFVIVGDKSRDQVLTQKHVFLCFVYTMLGCMETEATKGRKASELRTLKIYYKKL